VGYWGREVVRVLVCGVLPLVMFACNGRTEVTETAPEDTLVPAIVSRYAPLVYLYAGRDAEEQFLPMDAEDFIRLSALRWHHDGALCRDKTLAEAGEVDAAELGSGRYHARQTNAACLRVGDEFSTTDLTRPFDDRSETGEEGFYLDYTGALEGDAEPPWRVYFEYQPGRYITYWFFYAHNQPIKIGLDKIRLITRSRQVDWFGRHDGDWEHVSIQLQGTTPVALAVYAHGAPTPTPWPHVDTESGTHPIVFSAQGSHASYLDVGIEHPQCKPPFGCIEDPTGRGVQWRTWEDLRNARTRPWYGFGGGWGKVGPWAAEKIPKLRRDTSGPLGPSSWKTEVAPSGW
jgi:hypothetical protein